MTPFVPGRGCIAGGPVCNVEPMTWALFKILKIYCLTISNKH